MERFQGNQTLCVSAWLYFWPSDEESNANVNKNTHWVHPKHSAFVHVRKVLNKKKKKSTS